MRIKYWPLYLILSLSQSLVTAWGLFSLTANQKVLMEWISDIYQDVYSENQFSDRVLLIFSVLNSITGIGSVLGIFFVAPWSDKYGRKFVLAISTISNIAYSVLFFISKPLNSIVPMIIGRVIIGIPFALQSNILVYRVELNN